MASKSPSFPVRVRGEIRRRRLLAILNSTPLEPKEKVEAPNHLFFFFPSFPFTLMTWVMKTSNVDFLYGRSRRNEAPISLFFPPPGGRRKPLIAVPQDGEAAERSRLPTPPLFLVARAEDECATFRILRRRRGKKGRQPAFASPLFPSLAVRCLAEG